MLKAWLNSLMQVRICKYPFASQSVRFIQGALFGVACMVMNLESCTPCSVYDFHRIGSFRHYDMCYSHELSAVL